MKKLTNWTKKPVTWGAVIITSLISLVVGLIQTAIMLGLPGKLKDKFKSLKK